MFEVKDLKLITEFLEKIRERNIEYEYEITAPQLSSGDCYYENKKGKMTNDIVIQKIEIILYKETRKESK